jgi:hypothetical protein
MNGFEDALKLALERAAEMGISTERTLVEDSLSNVAYATCLEWFNALDEQRVVVFLKDDTDHGASCHNTDVWRAHYSRHPFFCCTDEQLVYALISNSANLEMDTRNGVCFCIFNPVNKLRLVIRYYDDYTCFYYEMYCDDELLQSRANPRDRQLKDISILFGESDAEFYAVWTLQRWGQFCAWFFGMIGDHGMKCTIDLDPQYTEISFHCFRFRFGSPGHNYLTFEAGEPDHADGIEMEWDEKNPYFSMCMSFLHHVTKRFVRDMANLQPFALVVHTALNKNPSDALKKRNARKLRRLSH